MAEVRTRVSGGAKPPPAPRVLVLGLGNEILSDDGAGLAVAREAFRLWQAGGGRGVEFREASLAGLELLDVLAGFDAAVVVDAAEVAGAAPGTVLEFGDLGDVAPAAHRLASVHDVSLAAALELGRRLGMQLPRTVAVVAVQVRDARTFGEGLSPEVAAAVPGAARRVVEMLRRLTGG